MAAQNGTLYLMSGNVLWTVDVYVEDATTGVWRFNPSGAAGAASDTTYRPPVNCMVYDFSVATGTTATGGIFREDNAIKPGSPIRYANQLNTIVNRPKLSIPLKAGALVAVSNF